MSGDPEDYEDPIKSAFTPASKMRASDQKEAAIMGVMEKMQHDFQRQLQELEERQMFLQMENDTLREMTTNQNQGPWPPIIRATNQTKPTSFRDRSQASSSIHRLQPSQPPRDCHFHVDPRLSKPQPPPAVYGGTATLIPLRSTSAHILHWHFRLLHWHFRLLH